MMAGVIAERYADGIGVDTQLLGFSMTKSVINALIGILTQQGVVTAVVSGADTGMAGGVRPAPRNRRRAPDADDHGSCAR